MTFKLKTHLTKLRKNRRYRHEQKSVLINGKKLASELAPILRLITTETSDIEAKEHFIVPESTILQISGLPSTDGVIAEVAMPKEADLRSAKRLIALDNIADPGNLGTLLRSSLALGFDGAIILGGVDPFNDKAIAAAKGASFRLPLAYSLEGLMQTKYIADLHGTPIKSCAFEEPYILVLGNESHGPTISGTPITIPIDNMESLNVASAGAIIMHEMRSYGR